MHRPVHGVHASDISYPDRAGQAAHKTPPVARTGPTLVHVTDPARRSRLATEGLGPTTVIRPGLTEKLRSTRSVALHTQLGVRDEVDRPPSPRAPSPVTDLCPPGSLVVRAPGDQLERLCRAAVTVTGVSSCGVTMVTDGGQNVTAHASDSKAQAVEDLQHTLGEGPGVDASELGRRRAGRRTWPTATTPPSGDGRRSPTRRWTRESSPPSRSRCCWGPPGSAR